MSKETRLPCRDMLGVAWGCPPGARLIRLLCCVGLPVLCCVGLPAWRTADYCVAAAARERRLALYVHSAAAERHRELPLDFWLQEVITCLDEAGRSVSRFLRWVGRY